MATATKTKAAPKKTVGSPNEQELQGKLDQAAAENAALQHRISQLSGFEKEVRELRETLDNLHIDLDNVTDERDAAVREAAQATAAAKSAADSASADATAVAHAKNLAESLKGLIT